MSKVMVAALAATFVMNLNSAQAQGNYGSYNQTPSSGYNTGSSQDQFYNQGSNPSSYNQGSNPSYYNQGQGTGQSYYSQGGNNPNNPASYNQNQGSNPSYYNQGSSGYNTPGSTNSNYQQSSPSQFNTDSNPANQPQSYNSKWGKQNRYTADNDDRAASTENKYPQDRASTDADRQLNARIRDKISGWFTDSYKNISLNTVNGVVTINGTVANNDDLTKLLKEVRKVDGVRNVNNNVQIRP